MESLRDGEDFTINTDPKAHYVLSDENAAIEESWASVIPSATERHVQGDIEKLNKQICKELQSKISSMSQIAETERAKRMQLTEHYTNKFTQLKHSCAVECK